MAVKQMKPMLPRTKLSFCGPLDAPCNLQCIGDSVDAVEPLSCSTWCIVLAPSYNILPERLTEISVDVAIHVDNVSTRFVLGKLKYA
jgi:hypothetical protein